MGGWFLGYWANPKGRKPNLAAKSTVHKGPRQGFSAELTAIGTNSRASDQTRLIVSGSRLQKWCCLTQCLLQSERWIQIQTILTGRMRSGSRILVLRLPTYGRVSLQPLPTLSSSRFRLPKQCREASQSQRPWFGKDCLLAESRSPRKCTDP